MTLERADLIVGIWDGSPGGEGGTADMLERQLLPPHKENSAPPEDELSWLDAHLSGSFLRPLYLIHTAHKQSGFIEHSQRAISLKEDIPLAFRLRFDEKMPPPKESFVTGMRWWQKTAPVLPDDLERYIELLNQYSVASASLRAQPDSLPPVFDGLTDGQRQYFSRLKAISESFSTVSRVHQEKTDLVKKVAVCFSYLLGGLFLLHAKLLKEDWVFAAYTLLLIASFCWFRAARFDVNSYYHAFFRFMREKTRLTYYAELVNICQEPDTPASNSDIFDVDNVVPVMCLNAVARRCIPMKELPDWQQAVPHSIPMAQQSLILSFAEQDWLERQQSYYLKSHEKNHKAFERQELAVRNAYGLTVFAAIATCMVYAFDVFGASAVLLSENSGLAKSLLIAIMGFLALRTVIAEAQMKNGAYKELTVSYGMMHQYLARTLAVLRQSPPVAATDKPTSSNEHIATWKAHCLHSAAARMSKEHYAWYASVRDQHIDPPSGG
jgi:hypothetical protein